MLLIYKYCIGFLIDYNLFELKIHILYMYKDNIYIYIGESLQLPTLQIPTPYRISVTIRDTKQLYIYILILQMKCT